MSQLVEIRNPKDIISTFLQIEISRATAQGGSYSVIATPDIDDTTASDLSQGYTAYNDSGGSSTSWYKFRYKNGSTYSPYSDEFQAGLTEMHTRFRREMHDSNSNNYFFSNAEIDDYLHDAVFSLWPNTWFEDIDESLTTLNTQEKYNYPYGVTRISEIEYVDSNGTVVGVAKGWKPRARKIIFNIAPTSGYTMRLYVDKMFTKFSEVPEVFDEYIIAYMKLKAYEVLLADRSQYYKYNSVVKAEGGNMPSLSREIDRLEKKISTRLNQLRRYRKPTDIGLV